MMMMMMMMVMIARSETICDMRLSPSLQIIKNKSLNFFLYKELHKLLKLLIFMVLSLKRECIHVNMIFIE
jgi:hypothetical protein